MLISSTHVPATYLNVFILSCIYILMIFVADLVDNKDKGEIFLSTRRRLYQRISPCVRLGRRKRERPFLLGSVGPRQKSDIWC